MKLEKVFKLLPHSVQQLGISLVNWRLFSVRHNSIYHSKLKQYKSLKFLPKSNLEELQEQKLQEFLKYVQKFSPYMSKRLENVNLSHGLKALDSIPFTSKEELRKNASAIYSTEKVKMVESRTGGTTGKPLVVQFTDYDVAERHAILDEFRGRFGYKFGEKTAWFSGKNIIGQRDIKRNRYWKHDFLHKIRYYSTFHINKHSAPYIIDNLNKFQPPFFVGFPSSLVEIAKEGEQIGKAINYDVKAIFPTAETIVDDEKELLERYFNTKVCNQYASSEGAPFITECENGNLHLEILTGVFEVLDEKLQPAQEGELVVTAFHTHGTPLIRYRIGDSIVKSNEKCKCGRNTPLVQEIQGRVNDYVLSPETGKINLGNLSNCLKYVSGVQKFQVIQDQLSSIEVKVVTDSSYSDNDEANFKKELVARLGSNMEINFNYVESIARESSGKFRLIKNSLNN